MITRNPHRGTRVGRLTLAALVVLAGLTACGTTDPGPGDIPGPAPAAVDRTDPKQVSDAFMNAYASGDLAAACAMGTPQLQQRLTSEGECAGQASWNQTVTGSAGCIDADDGDFYVTYDTDGYIDRYLTFIVRTTLVDGRWTPDAIRPKGPSSTPDYVCVAATESVADTESSPQVSAG